MEYLHDAITVKEFLNQVAYDHKSKFLDSVCFSTHCLLIFVIGCDLLAEMIASNIAAMH